MKLIYDNLDTANKFKAIYRLTRVPVSCLYPCLCHLITDDGLMEREQGRLLGLCLLDFLARKRWGAGRNEEMWSGLLALLSLQQPSKLLCKECRTVCRPRLLSAVLFFFFAKVRSIVPLLLYSVASIDF
jgi:hypothetical protein